MLRAVIAGERNPRVLADLALGRMRRKTALLEEALDCSFFTPEHAFVLAMMLANIDHYTAQVAVLDEKVAVLCEPYERQVAQLDAIPGFGVTAAQDLIADRHRHDSVPDRRTPVLLGPGRLPRVTESGGKRKGKNATGRGNPYIGGTLGEAAAGAGRTQSFLAAKYHRLCRHMPKGEARVAVMRTQLCIAHALLSDPEAEYRDLGPGYYEQRAGTRRQVRGHIRSLERCGYKVTTEPLNTQTSDPGHDYYPPQSSLIQDPEIGYGAVAGVADVNAHGGINSHKLNLIECNDQSDPSIAPSAVRRRSPITCPPWWAASRSTATTTTRRWWPRTSRISGKKPTETQDNTSLNSFPVTRAPRSASRPWACFSATSGCKHVGILAPNSVANQQSAHNLTAGS